MTWSPDSWRSCEARQQPAYPDPEALADLVADAPGNPHRLDAPLLARA